MRTRALLAGAAMALAGTTSVLVVPAATAAPPEPRDIVDVRRDGCGYTNIYIFGQPLFHYPMCQPPHAPS